MPGYGVEQFFAITAASGPAFSPDSRRVAYLCNASGVPQVWEVDAAGGAPEQLTATRERVSSVDYSPVDDVMVFAMDHGGDEHHQLSLLKDGRAMESLGEHPAAMHYFGGWSRDGRQFAFAANRRDPQHFDLYIRRAPAGEERLVLEGRGMNLAAGFTPDGRGLLYLAANTNLDRDLWLLDLASGERRLLTPHAGEAAASSPQCAPDGRWAYLVSDRDRDFHALWRLDLSSGEMLPLAEPSWDVEACALTRDGRLLAYTVNVDGASELHVLDAASGQEQALASPAQLPAGVFSELTWAPDSRRLALVVDGAESPTNVWLLDVVADQVTQLTRSELGGIAPETFVRPRLVQCHSFDGLRLSAWLYVPHGAQPDGSLPAVMLVHGGPESQARPTFNKSIQYLVDSGYVVLQPNVRGSTGYGKAFTHLDDRRRRYDSVADLKALWEWLAQSRWADPKKIAVMGGSYGGFMVLAAVTTYPDLWAAGVDIVGVANFETMLENTHPHRRYLREAEYGSLAEDREWFRQVSPIHHVEQITAAMIVLHGANDPRVPIGEAEQIVGRLRQLGRPVEYLRFEDEGHGLVKIPNQITGYGAIARFLDRHLKGRAP